MVAEVTDGVVALDRAAHFPSDDDAVFHQAYELTIAFDPVNHTDCDTKVNESIHGVGGVDLLSKWNGATIGYGFAPRGSIAEFDGLSAGSFNDGSLDSYVALLNRDGSFEGVGATLTSAFDFDPATGDVLVDGGGAPIIKDATAFTAEEPVTSAVVVGLPMVLFNLSFLADDLAR